LERWRWNWDSIQAQVFLFVFAGGAVVSVELIRQAWPGRHHLTVFMVSLRGDLQRQPVAKQLPPMEGGDGLAPDGRGFRRLHPTYRSADLEQLHWFPQKRSGVVDDGGFRPRLDRLRPRSPRAGLGLRHLLTFGDLMNLVDQPAWAAAIAGGVLSLVLRMPYGLRLVVAVASRSASAWR
jgi:hypothetical protein